MARPYACIDTATLIARRKLLAEQLLALGGRISSHSNEAVATTVQPEHRIQTQINDINEELHWRGELDLDVSVLPAREAYGDHSELRCR